MSVMKYRKKPVVIEAMKYTGKNFTECLCWTSNVSMESALGLNDIPGMPLFIHTLEGDMEANIGDYIIKGVKGEFYPCKPDIFEATYEKEPSNDDRD